jgi:hypothetical protein
VSKSWHLDGPVPLKSVFKDYLFGNPFQESGDRGRKSREPRKGPGMKPSGRASAFSQCGPADSRSREADDETP